MADGLLEVVAVRGVLQLGLAQISLTGATRLAQCSCLSISSTVPLPVQVDGEPFQLQPVFAPRSPMTLTVRLKNRGCESSVSPWCSLFRCGSRTRP